MPMAGLKNVREEAMTVEFSTYIKRTLQRFTWKIEVRMGVLVSEES